MEEIGCCERGSCNDILKFAINDFRQHHALPTSHHPHSFGGGTVHRWLRCFDLEFLLLTRGSKKLISVILWRWAGGGVTGCNAFFKYGKSAIMGGMGAG